MEGRKSQVWLFFFAAILFFTFLGYTYFFVAVNFLHDSLTQGEQSTQGDQSPAVLSGNDTIINYGNEVDIAVKDLKKANIAFSSPSVMQKNKVEAVTLMLGVRESIQDLLKAIESEEKESAIIKYTPRMKAELISENSKAFEIVEIAPSLQAIGTITPVRWRWDVTPLESGKQYLHLTLIALIKVDDIETALPIRTFHKEIEVKVAASDRFLHFLVSNWQWMIGSLILPLIIWYWKARKLSKVS